MSAPRTSGSLTPTEVGTRVPKFVDEANFRYFHRCWSEIDQTWRYHDAETSALVLEMRESARAALRREMRGVESLGPAQYMITV